MTLRFAFLGGFQVTQDEHPVEGFISDKARALLCYLAMEQRVHRRPELAALLWGEMPAEKAMTSLRQALSNLRRLVGDALKVDRHTVTFNRQVPHFLDVQEFVRLARAFYAHQIPATGVDAAALYQGDFLRGVYVHGAPAFEEWATVQRERLHQHAVRVFYQLALLYHEQGEYDLALVYLDRLLSLEPWNEEAHRQRMVLLARLGRFTAALRQYDKCRRVLKEELGLSPSQGTTALYHKIRGLQNRRGTHQDWPQQPTPFIGRADTLAQLNTWLTSPEKRMITILGPGGVGKTRLALAAAWHTRRAFLDGILFLSLASLASPRLLPSALLRAMNVPSRAPLSPAERIIESLQDEERLIILDGFEHWLAERSPALDEALALISNILKSAPLVKILVTSQEPLRIRWENRFPLQGFPCPARDATPSEGGEASDAVRLFLYHARRVNPDFVPLAADYAAIARICRLTEGLPLAIELAASWMGQVSSQRLAADLAHGISELTTTMRDVTPRHRSLQATFVYAWRLLDQEAQEALRRLSVFQGEFDDQQAQEIARVTPATLAALVDKSLLYRTAASRYGMHGMIRAFAAAYLRESGEDVSTRARHLDYFLAWVQKVAPHLRGPNQGAWVKRLKESEADVAEALRFARESGRGEAGLRLAVALWPFWDIVAALGEGRQWLTTMLDMTPHPPPELAAQALKGAGVLAWRQFDFEAAAHYQQASLALMREMGDDLGMAGALANLALIALDSGNPEWASSLYAESLAIFRRLGDTPNIALALNNMGVIAMQRQNFEAAHAYLEESLALYRDLGQRRGISWALGNLGNVARHQGEWEHAVSLYKEALALQQDLGDRYAVALSLANLGHALALLGDPQQALTLYQDAWITFQELDAVGDMAETLERAGAAHIALGRVEKGVHLLAQAEHLRDTHHVPRPPLERRYHDQSLAQAREQLGSHFQEVWDAGRHQAWSLSPG